MKSTKTFTIGDRKFHLLFLTTVGSTLHKLNLEHSDLDLKGVFLWEKDLTYCLEPQQDSLDYKNTNKLEWSNLMKQLNKEFNLKLTDNDDLNLFEARKFMSVSLKNDFNMFDLLFNNLEPIFLTDSFTKILNNKENFLHMEFAKSRFRGMAKSSLKDARKLAFRGVRNKKENNDFYKSMAKSLQFLFSLSNLLKEQSYNPVLKEFQRKEVLEVKKGLKSFYSVENRYIELNEKLEKTFLNEKLLYKKSDVDFVNKLLVNLFKENY